MDKDITGIQPRVREELETLNEKMNVNIETLAEDADLLTVIKKSMNLSQHLKEHRNAPSSWEVRTCKLKN